MTRRQKLITTVICLSAILCCLVTGSIALLIAETQTIENTFTPSNIAIELKEDGAVENKQNFQMVPGATLPKAATVKVTNDVPCYVFLEVKKVNNVDNYIAYAVNTAWKLLPKVQGEDANTLIYYMAVDTKNASTTIDVLAAGEFAFVLGDKTTAYKWNANEVLVLPTVTKTMMDALSAEGAQMPTLSFAAYAIQSEYLPYGDLEDNEANADARARIAWDTLKASSVPGTDTSSEG